MVGFERVHELSIAQRVLSIASNAAGGGRIVAIRMRVGALTCIDPDTLVHAFEIVANDTPAAGCRVDIERVAPRLRCKCGAEADRDWLDACPSCGAQGGDVLEGRELLVESIDVDEPAMAAGSAT
jgi:hydrogenase nickel incorporation protein HypA/HybF